jgi:predicted XRE-type DNA-binding protein
MPRVKSEVGVIPSSGNVFADLGLTNAEEKQRRVRLALVINQIIQSRALSQAIAARHLKVNQPKVSALSNYRLDGFFRRAAMKYLTALDQDVEIVNSTQAEIAKKWQNRSHSNLVLSLTRAGAGRPDIVLD